MDIRFAMYAKGVMTVFKYLIYFIFGIALIFVSHMAPVMAAFADTIPHLARNSVYFASKNPVRALAIAALNIGPLILTYYGSSETAAVCIYVGCFRLRGNRDDRVKNAYKGFQCVSAGAR